MKHHLQLVEVFNVHYNNGYDEIGKTEILFIFDTLILTLLGDISTICGYELTLMKYDLEYRNIDFIGKPVDKISIRHLQYLIYRLTITHILRDIYG
jgi:hypothetical protein